MFAGARATRTRRSSVATHAPTEHRHDCDGNAFDEKQPDDPSVAGAKSLAHGDLVLSRSASKQEQIADVETRREQ